MSGKTATATCLSFLDVLCSALGGMVILAVIFSIVKNPIQRPVRDEFILVTVDADGSGARLGLLVESPRGEIAAVLPNEQATEDLARKWSDVIGKGILALLGHDRAVGSKGATRLHVEIREPAIGTWIFKPLMFDWANDNSMPVVIIRVQAWTRQGPVQFESVRTNGPETLAAAARYGATPYTVQIGE